MTIATDELLRASGTVSLASLEPGAAAVIDRVEAASSVGERLSDLGFLPKTPIRVLRRAPLGDPIEYELRGYRLCLRSSEAARIRVQPLREGDAPPR